MPAIVLTTLNARYIHADIGLRYLYANLQQLQDQTVIQEFTVSDQLTDIAEKILAQNPAIIGLGVYIWNGRECEQLVRILKAIAPEVLLVLGGPEVSHFPHRLDFSLADHIVCGEGEQAFFELCAAQLAGENNFPRVLMAEPPALDTLKMPYAFYTDQDIAHRVIYVEASRGCPFSCEFCLSSMDKRVRYFDLDQFLAELETLWQRGARNIKFIDRTFNLSIQRVEPILDFFLEKEPPYLVHFEVVPEHFPNTLRKKLRQFPPGTLQLEVGIQTLNSDVAASIHRRLDMEKIQTNLHFLETETHAHLHVDLIIGLPGESAESFGHNLNRLASLTRAEIQLGVLKKLSGTTLDRHDARHGMKYLPYPPYEILANDMIDFTAMQDLKRMARFWDLLYNSGNFNESVRLLWPDQDVYGGFLRFSRWLYQATLSTWQISLKRMAELLFTYLSEECGFPKSEVANTMAADILKIKGRSLPAVIAENTTVRHGSLQKKTAATPGKRQAKHLT
ncbi:B12-binding domain-containing radical SAM protein [Desulfogranum japonicum]|uniref:B12-binding domain-containing radical SAM protein n=1 Tax=Desulfogranum japonicum TaxID=231447 RepID=UPI000429A60F|nr:B12-binding domain-containing radical SAM protein [Desulfogranum japonicum]